MRSDPLIIDEAQYFERTGRLFPPGVTSEAEIAGQEDSDSPALKEAEYRRLHARNGDALGSAEYPDNREGRRKLARTWRRH